MLSRPTNDRQTLDLQNAESCTAWIMSLVAKCRAEKKEDEVNTDGMIVDLQVTNLFFRICSQDALLKLRSLMSSKKFLDTPFKDIRQSIQNYISPKERVETAERAKFLSVVQCVGNLTPVKRRDAFQNYADVRRSLSQLSLTSTTISARKRVNCLVKHHPNWRWECSIHGKKYLSCR